MFQLRRKDQTADIRIDWFDHNGNSVYLSKIPAVQFKTISEADMFIRYHLCKQSSQVEIIEVPYSTLEALKIIKQHTTETRPYFSATKAFMWVFMTDGINNLGPAYNENLSESEKASYKVLATAIAIISGEILILGSHDYFLDIWRLEDCRNEK